MKNTSIRLCALIALLTSILLISSCTTTPKKNINYEKDRARCKDLCSYYTGIKNTHCAQCCNTQYTLANTSKRHDCLALATNNNAQLNQNIKNCYLKNNQITGKRLRACANAGS